MVSLFTLFMWLIAPVCGQPSQANVILLMLDGVRWQEVFHGSDPSIDSQMNEPDLLSSLFRGGDPTSFIFGDKNNGSICTVSNNELISLPGYQSIMAGKDTGCVSNSCGRIQIETMQERILQELHLDKIEVATIASWPKIADAVEKQGGSTFVNVGITPLLEGRRSKTTFELNEKQEADRPLWDGRKDEYTFAHSINFIQNNRPRFIFISLGDSDELAHQGKYKEYIATIKGYNEKIERLFSVLDDLGEYGKSTIVIITTDHGRGDGSAWTGHGPSLPESKYIWIFGRNPRVGFKTQKPVLSGTGYSHVDIRPTIEKLMGLTPIECDGCGKVIWELIPESAQSLRSEVGRVKYSRHFISLTLLAMGAIVWGV